jgi:hypothetical protein
LTPKFCVVVGGNIRGRWYGIGEMNPAFPAMLKIA